MTRARAILVVTGLLAAALSGEAAAGEAARLRRDARGAAARRGARPEHRRLARFEAEVEARRAGFRAAAGLPAAAQGRRATGRGARRLRGRPRAPAGPAAASVRARGERSLGRVAAHRASAPLDEPPPGPRGGACAGRSHRGSGAPRAVSRASSACAPRACAAPPCPQAPEPLRAASAIAAAATGRRRGPAPSDPCHRCCATLATELGGALEIYSFVRNGIAVRAVPRRAQGRGADVPREERQRRGHGGAARRAAARPGHPRPLRRRDRRRCRRRRCSAGRHGGQRRGRRARAGARGHPARAGALGRRHLGRRMARVWVEAHLPYVNYRGLDIDAQGKAWVPLDAAFKLHEPPSGLDVVSELGFDPRAAFDDYLAEPRPATPREFVRARIEGLLAAQRPGVTLRRGPRHASDGGREDLGLLPNTLPYAGHRAPKCPTPSRRRSRTAWASAPRSGQRHDPRARRSTPPTCWPTASRSTTSPSTTTTARWSRSTAACARRRRTSSRCGPSCAWAAWSWPAGGPVGFGVKYTLRLELRTPSGTETVTNTLLAGNLTAIGFGGRRGTASGARARTRRPRSWPASPSATWSAGTSPTRSWRACCAWCPSGPRSRPASPCPTSRCDYAGGDPLYPLTFEWKGVAIDADFRPMAPVGIETRAREAALRAALGAGGRPCSRSASSPRACRSSRSPR